MKRLIRILSTFILLLLIMPSCNKSWLKPDPLSLLTPENVYTNKAGFESLLITMRKNLKKEAYGGRHPIAQEFAASDLAIPIYGMDWRKLTPNGDGFWKYLDLFTIAYGAIKDANVSISRIDKIEWKKEEAKNAVLAESYWHRAYWYYRLVNSYGDVPWIGKEVQEAKLDFTTYSRWTILDKLEADLEFAVQWLPEDALPGAISKGAGYMLLAKVALANTDFDKAVNAATKVINGQYSLMTQRFGIDAGDAAKNVIWDLHRPKNMNSPQNRETILATVDRFEAPPGAKTDGTYTMRLYNCAFYNAVVKDSKGIHGTMDAGGEYDSLGRGNADVRLDYYYQYSLWAYEGQRWDNTTDLRRSDINWVDIDEIYYNNPASVNYGEPLNPKWFASMGDTIQVPYAMPFYITYVPQQGTGRPYGGNGDWYIYRLAGTYLIRAEAYFWNGNLAAAAADINKVRQRAHALPITPDQVTIDFIFDERARELFAEGLRHSELVRVSYIMAKLNKQGYSLNNFSKKNYYYDRVIEYNNFYGQDLTFYSNHIHIAPYNVLWPVPSEVITANTLGHINQNIGYDGTENNVPPLTDPIK